MDRRKAMKTAAGMMAAGGAGLIALMEGFKTDVPAPIPERLEYKPAETSWQYVSLDPAVTAGLAYDFYNEGSCMYATVKSVISQLAEKVGAPFNTFPFHMFKYGHGGVGGYGTVCGTLNGAAAIIGLLVADKKVQDTLIANIFQWYENQPLPEYRPAIPYLDFTPLKSTSGSVLCHASNTNWCKTAEFSINSAERKERCRRLTSDVAQKVTDSLNNIFTQGHIIAGTPDATVNRCVSCHSDHGKIKNISVGMNCNSCHSESVAHHVFSDIHYVMMPE